MRIRHIYISDAHNFFGHHGKPAGTRPMLEVPEVECVAGRGLAGDRFFDYKPDYSGQITFIAWETIQALRARFGLPVIDPAIFRRNVVVEGVDLNALIGSDFDLQDVRFHGTQEASPCYWMDQALCPGTEEALRGQGGLRARILTDGLLRADAAVASGA